jgi:hypothetical protein
MTKPNLSAVARAAGLTPSVLHSRLHAGWTLEEALNTPKHGRRRKSAPVNPTTKTKAIEQPVLQESSPSWMPIVAVAVLALLAVLSFYA